MGHARIRGNASTTPGIADSSMSLADSDVTVGEVLKNAGYTSAIIGKWGVGNPGTEGMPHKQGFDYSFGFLDQVFAHNHYPPSMIRNGAEFQIPENAGNSLTNPAAPGKKYGKYANDMFTDDAISFVQNNKAKPFHLQLWYTVPHAGLEVPEDSKARYLNRWGAETPYASNGHYPAQAHPRATYAAMVTRMDRDIGRLMQTLKDQGLDRDTVVFFSSDNGSSVAGGIDRDFFNSMGPYRDYKGSMYEGGIRSPLIARWPGRIPAGAKSNELTASWDFLATAAEIAGTAAPATDGISILPTLLGQNQTRKHEHLYWEQQSAAGLWQVVRKGDWKLVKSDKNRFELFNLVADRAETRDLYDAHPDIVKDLKIRMANSRTTSPYYTAVNLDLLGVKCNANRTANGRLVLPTDPSLAASHSIACLENPLSATGFSWQPLDSRNAVGVQCNATGQAAYRVSGALTCAPEATSPTKWIWKLSTQVPQKPVPNPNDVNTWIGYQCNANNTAAGRISDVVGKSIVCLESANSPTGFAWHLADLNNPKGYQCNATGQAAYRVSGTLTCKPWPSSPTGWRWQ